VGKGKTRQTGRPPLPPESIKSEAIGLRVTPQLKELLVKASAASNRSIASEAETRILASFAAEGGRELPDVLEAEFGTEGAALMLAIGIVIEHWRTFRAYSNEQGRRWMSNPRLFGRVAEGIRTLLQTMDPSTDPAVLESFRTISGLDDGQIVDLARDDPKIDAQSRALIFVDEIGFLDLGIGIGPGPWAERIRHWLGDAALKRLRDRMPPAPEPE
jgi:hypothetical protein